jgi:hypothetical protein
MLLQNARTSSVYDALFGRRIHAVAKLSHELIARTCRTNLSHEPASPAITVAICEFAKANFGAGIRICEATATVCTCCSMVSHMTYAIFVSTCCDASAQCMHSEYEYDVLLYAEVMLVALNATY